MRTLAPADVNDALSDLVDEICRSGEQVSVTRNGVPVVVAMTIDDYESLMFALGVSRVQRFGLVAAESR